MRVYLVIIDETEEALVALRFASRRAARTEGSLHLLALVPPQEFNAFAGVQATIEDEARARAETLVTSAAGSLFSESGKMPIISVRHGEGEKVVREYLTQHPEVSALVLGAGGAGRAVVWALAGAGMEVSLWNRTASRAEDLAAEMNVSAIGDQVGLIDPGEFDVIVNASAAGLGGDDGLADLPLDPERFRPGQTVVDMVYGDGPGRLLEAASLGGATTIDGLEILVRQGARSLRIWTSLAPDLDVMERAARS